MSLSKKLSAYSVAAGAAAMGVATSAQAALQIYDHRASPIYAWVSYAGQGDDMMVLKMDGTYKHAITSNNWGDQSDYTYYDQDGVTTPIDAADKTGAAVWLTYEFYEDEGGGDKEGVNLHTSVDNGVAGFTDGSAQRPYLLQEDVDIVGGNLNYYTDGSGVSIFGFGSYGSGEYDGYGYGEHFLGFFIDEVDGRHYGWVNIDQPWSRIETRVKGWGYQDEAGLPAPAGYSPPTGSFNGDFEIDEIDIDMLCDAIRTGSLDLGTYDLSGPGEDGVPDGVIDVNDLDYLIHQLVFTTAGTTGTEYGDFNLDGLVDTTDLTRLATNYGLGTKWDEGNANRNFDLLIDTTDLTILATFFGFGAPDAVPEPTTLSLLAIGGAAAMRRRRK